MPERLAVARLDARAAVPGWAMAPSPLAAVVRTGDELSILTRDDVVPDDVRAELFVSIAQPLAQAGLPIFALSTFDTDYVLVKEDRLGEALRVLRAAGHVIG